jgi:hypothetical protein
VYPSRDCGISGYKPNPGWRKVMQGICGHARWRVAIASPVWGVIFVVHQTNKYPKPRTGRHILNLLQLQTVLAAD